MKYLATLERRAVKYLDLGLLGGRRGVQKWMVCHRVPGEILRPQSAEVASYYFKQLCLSDTVAPRENRKRRNVLPLEIADRPIPTLSDYIHMSALPRLGTLTFVVYGTVQSPSADKHRRKSLNEFHPHDDGLKWRNG